MTGLLIYYHWEAMLVSYLATRFFVFLPIFIIYNSIFDCKIEDFITFRKTVLPFTDVENMYSKTTFRLAMIPDTTYVDNFKYSPDPIFQHIFTERIEPNLQEYRDYPDHLSDMIHFIKEDPTTALLDGFIPIA